MGYTSDENSATVWLRRDSDMSDVDFHDETGNQPGTVSVDVGGHVFTALVDPSVSCTVERVFTTTDAACRKAGGPISFTKRELAKPVGVGVKAIGNALERLRTDNRVTTERRGQRYWYQTVWERSITEQGQLALVNVAAITSRPAPVTRLDQLGSTVHAGSTHPEGIGREPGENPARTRRESGGNQARTRRESGGKWTRSYRLNPRRKNCSIVLSADHVQCNQPSGMVSGQPRSPAGPISASAIKTAAHDWYTRPSGNFVLRGCLNWMTQRHQPCCATALESHSRLPRDKPERMRIGQTRTQVGADTWRRFANSTAVGCPGKPTQMLEPPCALIRTRAPAGRPG